MSTGVARIIPRFSDNISLQGPDRADLLGYRQDQQLCVVPVQATSQAALHVGPRPQSASPPLLLQRGHERLDVNIRWIRITVKLSRRYWYIALFCILPRRFYLYKFYINLRPILPSDPDKIWVSDRRRNFTEIMNDIMFSGGSSGALSPLTRDSQGAILALILSLVNKYFWIVTNYGGHALAIFVFDTDSLLFSVHLRYIREIFTGRSYL